ncbi:22591_t:CDS:1, partial [Racocetra persica]
QEVQSRGSVDSFSMGFNSVIADISQGNKRDDEAFTSSGYYCFGFFKSKRAMQEPSLKTASDIYRLVRILLEYADGLVFWEI